MRVILSRRTPVAVAALLTAGLFLGALAGGCVVASGSDSENPVSLDAELTASDAVSRAEEWVAANLQYCQSPNHARDYDTACSTFCERTDNAAWDPYRSDCSGLVSWAWGLPAPGRVTGEFAPFQDDITYAIPASSLQPGDAVNNAEHVMLFKAWVVQGHEATFIEEPGCSANPPHAHEFTSNVSINGDSIYVPYNGMTFTAIRYAGFSNSGPPGCSVNGVQGTCIDTGACAAKGGHHSTPGLCPGPASEECCTPDSSPPPPPPPPPTAPSCTVGGVQGTCIDTSVCAGKAGYHSTPGYCPGPASEECCTKDAAPPPPPPPPSGPSCTVEGVQGVCIDKSVCAGMAGHVSTPGFCPGPASEECCTQPPTCHANGKAGMCIETSVCASLGRHSTAGLCPGPANEECCTP
jgi:hypothetical protein